MRCGIAPTKGTIPAAPTIPTEGAQEGKYTGFIRLQRLGALDERAAELDVACRKRRAGGAEAFEPRAGRRKIPSSAILSGDVPWTSPSVPVAPLASPASLDVGAGTDTRTAEDQGGVLLQTPKNFHD